MTATLEMPLFWKKDKDINYKARLEHKLYLARENPEPVFDVSDCALKTVPSGVFSLCKVFRKEALFLQENQLTSLSGGGKIEDLFLLHILDLHSNCFQKLPNDIVYLKNLRVLDISANKLSFLPDNIGEMTKLKSLNVSNNDLKSLPNSIGKLKSLKHLNVQLNTKLNRLPLSLCHNTLLEEIILDVANYDYPPQNIINDGTVAILKFLCSEEGIEYVPCEHVALHETSDENKDWSNFEERDSEFQAKILQLEKLKEDKQRGRLALEQVIFEQQRKELELQNSMKINKEKLLEDLAQQQNQLEGEILRVQEEQDSERLRFVEELQHVEAAANNLVSQLLAGSNLKDSKQIQKLVEQESEEEQRLLNSCHEEYQSLRHKDLLSAMESILEEEIQREAKIRDYEKGRAESTRTILSLEAENDEALNKLLSKHGHDRDGLTHQLQRDEELQRAAVATLMERGDARSWGLTQHLRLVQEQLAALTAIEMKKRQLQLNEQLDELCMKRAALSELLVGILAQQAARRKQLLETLNELERRKCEDEERRAHDFWLVQYQRLLDCQGSTLSELERSLDPILAQYLLQEGVVHCLPLLTNWILDSSALEQLTHDDLLQAGILSPETRESIMKAVTFYLSEKRTRNDKLSEQTYASVEPTAPVTSDVEVVSHLGAAECVICMDNTCEIIFVPCGHLCSCIKCAEPLQDCPLCRGDINQKIRVILP